MFGYHKAKRAQKRAQKQAEINMEQPYQEKSNEQVKQQVAEDVAAAKESRKQAREEGKTYAQEVLGRDVQGLDPKEKAAMQYEANKQVKRGQQSASRKLLGQQSMYGVGGRSGVAYAQQRDLQKMGQETMAQNLRDIDRLDQEAKLKNLAAMINLEQGEAAQDVLDRQIALDMLKLEEEKKKQKYYQNRADKNFSRI